MMSTSKPKKEKKNKPSSSLFCVKRQHKTSPETEKPYSKRNTPETEKTYSKRHEIKYAKICRAEFPHEESLNELFGKVKKNTKIKEVDQENSEKVLVVCPVTNRLGSNARFAMEGYEGNGKNTALLVLHPQAKHVSFNSRSEDVLTEDPYCNLGAIIDVLITLDGELYDCDVNKEAIKRISAFLQQKVHSVFP